MLYMDLEYQEQQASLVLERTQCVEQLIEYKICELNWLINDFVNKLKLKIEKKKERFIIKIIILIKSTKQFKLFIL